MEKNDNTHKLIGYILSNQADKAIEILKSNEYDKSVLEDIGFTTGKLPLWLITKLTWVILEEDDWHPYYFEMTILPSRKGCGKLYSYFRDEMGFPLDDDVDFAAFPDVRGRYEGWDIEDLLDAPLEDLVKMGYDADECLLCYAVLVGDLDIINEQIAKGTNPNVYIDGKRPPEKAEEVYASNSYNALYECSDFLSDALLCYDLGTWWSYGLIGSDELDFDWRAFYTLIQSAFYSTIGRRLEALTK